MKNWIVFAPGNVTISRADTSEEARADVLSRFPRYRAKPYLARDWAVREATAEEARRYAAMADHEAASDTPKQGRKPRKTVEARLFG